MIEWLPHFGVLCNATVTVLVILGYAAIRRGDRELHPKLMKGALVAGVLFLTSYIVQWVAVGHSRYPGTGWLRTLFLGILFSHTVLAVVTVPLVLRTAYLGIKDRLEGHRRIARFALPIWLYVGVTGVVIYLMNQAAH